jgi:hypothetical protein
MFARGRIVALAVVSLVPVTACELAFPVNSSGPDASTTPDAATPPADEASTEGASNDGTSNDGTSNDGTSNDGTSNDETSNDANSATTESGADASADADAAPVPTDAGCEASFPPDGSTCRLFHNDCAMTPGQGCFVNVTAQGTFSNLTCQPVGPDGFGARCNGPPDCAQDLACVGVMDPDGGLHGECRYWCFRPGEQPPFDTCGIDPRAPGSGGCPPSWNCHPSYAPWLGVCGP